MLTVVLTHLCITDDAVGVSPPTVLGQSQELLKSMGWRHVFRQPIFVQFWKEQGRAPVEFWPLAAQHHAFALNTTIPDDKDKSPSALHLARKSLSRRPRLVQSCCIGSIATALIPSSPKPTSDLPEKIRNHDSTPLMVKQYELVFGRDSCASCATGYC